MRKKKKLPEIEPKQEKIGIATKFVKEKILEYLTEIPIAKYAYSKANVPKATYYKWKKTDPKFNELSNASMLEGKTSVNDLARSQLMKKIQEGNLTGIIFWLKHNDPDFNPRIAIELKREEPLSKEQVIEIATAMKHIGLAGILESEKALLKKFKESPAGPIEIVNRERWADAYRRYKEEESGMQRMKKLDSEK